ncbi:MAG: restriction endonuclease subunit S [Oscillospiraceae bacterium]|nr:restriction endonuclease subunit S [Oscillospiraceae bacterium]
MNEELKKRIAQINAGTAPEGYKKTKLGIIPVEWELYRLSEITEELTEKAGNNEYETLSISAGIGFVNQANKFGKELSGKQYEKYIVLHRGDFSYNKGNSKKYPQGCIYQLNDRDSAAVPNVFESFRLIHGANDYYEQLFISGFLNCQLFAKINHGVRDDGLLNLKGEDFYSCYIPSPPLPEQQKIAEILTTQDKLIELQEQKIEQLKALKKAYLQKMFPKKGSRYPELRFKGFMDAWEQRKLGECVTFLDTMRKPLKESEREKGIYPYYGASGIVDYVSDYIFDEELVLLSEDGANITDRNYPVCFLASGKYWVNNHAHVLKVNAANENNFICNSLERMDFTQYNSGMAMPKLNKDVCYNITLFCPVYEEQKQIGDFFRHLDSLITLHQRKLEQEKQKKKALMQLLLTGKVRVKP